MSCFEISAKNGMCFNRKLFNNYSSSLNGLWVNSPWDRMVEWAVDSEAMRARGIIVLVKSKKGQIDGQKYRDKTT